MQLPLLHCSPALHWLASAQATISQMPWRQARGWSQVTVHSLAVQEPFLQASPFSHCVQSVQGTSAQKPSRQAEPVDAQAVESGQATAAQTYFQPLESQFCILVQTVPSSLQLVMEVQPVPSCHVFSQTSPLSQSAFVLQVLSDLQLGTARIATKKPIKTLLVMGHPLIGRNNGAAVRRTSDQAAPRGLDKIICIGSKTVNFIRPELRKRQSHGT
jgi:hypothetical protein